MNITRQNKTLQYKTRQDATGHDTTRYEPGICISKAEGLAWLGGHSDDGTYKTREEKI